jgi:hypothetical protein
MRSFSLTRRFALVMIPLTTLAAEESGTEPDAVAQGEIAARRARIEDDRRADEQNRLLLRSLYP